MSNGFMQGIFNGFPGGRKQIRPSGMKFGVQNPTNNNFGITPYNNGFLNTQSLSMNQGQYWDMLSQNVGNGNNTKEANGKSHGYSEKTSVSTSKGADGATVTTISSTISDDFPSVNNEISVQNYTHIKQTIEDFNRNYITPLVAEALESRGSGKGNSKNLNALKEKAHAAIDYLRDMQKIQEQVLNALKAKGEISNDEKITEYTFNVFPNWDQGIFDTSSVSGQKGETADSKGLEK